MNASPLRRVLAVTLSAAVVWSPAAPAAAQLRTAPVAAPVVPAGIAPIAGALADRKSVV